MNPLFLMCHSSLKNLPYHVMLGGIFGIPEASDASRQSSDCVGIALIEIVKLSAPAVGHASLHQFLGRHTVAGGPLFQLRWGHFVDAITEGHQISPQDPAQLSQVHLGTLLHRAVCVALDAGQQRVLRDHLHDGFDQHQRPIDARADVVAQAKTLEPPGIAAAVPPQHADRESGQAGIETNDRRSVR